MKGAPDKGYTHLSQMANRYPILARDEEVLLTRRVRDFHDKSAAERLTRCHLRVVLAMAVKYRHYDRPMSDLVAEGNCGLVHALRRFDPERGIRFATYAQHWIRAYILAHVIRSSSLVSCTLGKFRSQTFFKLRRERSRIVALFGEGPAADEALAQRLDIGIERLHSLLQRLDSRDVSLDVPAEQSGGRVAESLASCDNPELSLFDSQCSEVAGAAVAAALLELDPRERFIAERRLMAAPAEEMSLADIARSMGVSRERARQLEQRAKLKLRRSAAIRRNSELREWFAELMPSYAEAG